MFWHVVYIIYGMFLIIYDNLYIYIYTYSIDESIYIFDLHNGTMRRLRSCKGSSAKAGVTQIWLG